MQNIGTGLKSIGQCRGADFTQVRHSSIYVYERCFTPFADRTCKYKLYGQAALVEHKLICNELKAIHPVMPKEWWSLRHGVKQIGIHLSRTQNSRLSFSSLRRKKGSKGIIKASGNVPIELLEVLDIPLVPIIYRGSETNQEVAE